MQYGQARANGAANYPETSENPSWQGAFRKLKPRSAPDSKIPIQSSPKLADQRKIPLLLLLAAIGCGSSPVLAQTEANSFTDLCSRRDELPRSARRTINTLLDKAKTEDCAEAQQTLTSRSILDLSSSDVEDLTPLQSLPHLRQLNLYDNRVEDLTSYNFV